MILVYVRRPLLHEGLGSSVTLLVLCVSDLLGRPQQRFGELL